jgi:serine/threonine-protein kinase
MELIEGESLSAALARGGRLPAAGTLDLIEQAATALQAAHAAGIVHRDIKPGNMMITPEGRVKITDFGIARAVLAAPLTQTGMVIGTAQYVSPEQASGGPVTAASDIYSLGVVGYECLASRPPFTAETPLALALAHVSSQPPPLPGSVPRAVAALIGQMLAKDPADRPGSAEVVAERARALRDGLLADGSPMINGGQPGAAPVTAPPTIVDGPVAGPAGGIGEPAAWFSVTSPASPVSGPAGTAPMRGKGERRGRRRRSAVPALIVIAVLTVLTAGAIAVISASRHPAAAAGPTRPAGRAKTHQASLPRQRSHHDQGTLAGDPPSAPTTPVKPTATPTRSPTQSASPSPSPDPSGTPTGTTTPTPPPTPTGTGTSSSPPGQTARQPGTTKTQDG